ncbi:MAG: NAD+ synthase [Patescibacteria group bacterium]
MKIALLQLNFTVGDLEGNTTKIIAGYQQAKAQGARYAVSSELAIFGYPPQDLLEFPEYLERQDAQIERLRQEVKGETSLIVGIAERNTTGTGKPLFNSVIHIYDQQVLVIGRKCLLPTYDVFDEQRYFTPAELPRPIRRDRTSIATLVCEDIWYGSEFVSGHHLYKDDPVGHLEGLGVDFLFVLNGSPYTWHKGRERFTLVQNIAQRCKCNVVYVNQVGGNDDILFDGRSFVVNPQGECIGAAEPFKEQVVIVDMDNPTPVAYPFDDNLRDLYDALVMATRDYIAKVGCQQGVVIGLSGGIDSALTAAIAVDALGPDKVVGITMPSVLSSSGSVSDSLALAKNLGIQCFTVPIGCTVDSYGKALEPIIGWYPATARPGDVTEENIQARTRGNILMALSNRVGKIVLTTGNKSEVAVGYCTLYGDMAGGYAVISDIPKTLVYALSRYVNRFGEIIPESTLTKPPSAELRPDQKDTDSLPAYEVLDPILKAYNEDRMTVGQIIELGLADAATVHRVIRMVNTNEFKRRQLAPGPKVTSKAFGSGRRMPIAAKMIS